MRGRHRNDNLLLLLNKTITTGEGGMAVTNDERLAKRMRTMSLHGLTENAWNRFGGGGWDYKIIAPGYKYNLTDIASAIGIHQLRKAETLRQRRESIATAYQNAFTYLPAIALPPTDPDRVHSWHIYPIRLSVDSPYHDRETFMQALRSRGIATSVHWRPLHLHPYYETGLGWSKSLFPVATQIWTRLVSLPLSPMLTDEEVRYIIATIQDLCCSSNQVKRRWSAA